MRMAGKNPPGHRPCRPVSEVRQPDRPLPNHLNPPKRPKRPKRPGHTPKSRPAWKLQTARFRPGTKRSDPPRPKVPTFSTGKDKEKRCEAPLPDGRFLAFRFYQANPPEPPTAFSGKEKQRETPHSVPPCIGNFPSSDYSACRTAVIRSRSSDDDWAMYSAAAAF